MRGLQILSDLFPTVLNMSLTGGIIILIVLAARLLLRKAPRICSYALWAVVLFRLLCPISLGAPFSILRPIQLSSTGVTARTTAMEYVETEPESDAVSRLSQESPRAPGAYTAYDGNHRTLVRVNREPSDSPGTVAAPAGEILSGTLLSRIWLAGCLVVFLYNAFSVLRLRRKLVGCVHLRDNIWLADHIPSPFVMGLVRPKIYLPSFLDEKEHDLIICHEQVHIRRLDYITRLLAFFALCIHWFNPLVWIAFLISGRDMEMSCDEAVIRQQGDSLKADYSTSLLHLATRNSGLASMPLAFFNGDTKARIHNLLHRQTPRLRVRIAAGALCAACIAVTAVNPICAQTVQTGRYSSMEDFADQAMKTARTITFYERSGHRSTASIQETKLEWLEQTASVENLAPDGVLEAWRFNYLIRIDSEPDCALTYFREGNDRWYPLDKYNVGYNLIALRYEDGSYDVLYNESEVESADFFRRYTSYEQAVHDWYISEYGLNLPLYIPPSATVSLPKNDTLQRYNASAWFADLPSGELSQAEEVAPPYATDSSGSSWPVIPYGFWDAGP